VSISLNPFFFSTKRWVYLLYCLTTNFISVFDLIFFCSIGGALYCVCKDGVGDQNLQKAIDYACGAGADCTQIQQNGPCFQPNTIKDHCNYAVNSYFQKKGQAQGACDFAGMATPSQTPPTCKLTLFSTILQIFLTYLSKNNFY